jgi:hypothetical protein
MIGYCEMLLEDAAGRGQEDLVLDLQKIHVAAQCCLALINDLVNFSPMMKPGEPCLDLQAADTSAMRQQEVTVIRPLIKAEADTVQADHGSLLVVDDQEINRDMLSRRLERRGYSVAVAEGGRQALEMITTQQFELVLLDIVMPGISGLEVLRLLRAQYSAADLPVIMATARRGLATWGE